MKYLILVKHSLPEIIENIPAREWHLSNEGRTAAQQLAKRLEFYQPEIVVSSSEPKAVETAEIVASFLNLPVNVAENLHEHNRSKVAYLNRNQFESIIQEFFNKPNKLVFGSETANQSHLRFRDAVYSLLSNSVNQTVVIIAHGTVISLFVSRLTGISDYLLWSELGLPSFVVLDMETSILVAKENIP